ncbi:MAG: cyclopropane-fatty-acyl-phospholipid synthase family protein [Acidobacteria bacterium]|nr:cyclopropane-fatty-acyl-phospholipid synthase family protein [Acidobacteriota bacterium]
MAEASSIVHHSENLGGGYDRGIAVARRIVHRLLTRVTSGTIDLVERGQSHRYGSGPSVRVTVLDPRAYVAVLRGGSAGFGRSFVAGWWECDDVTTLVRILIRSLERPLAPLDRWARWIAPVRDRLPERRRRERPTDREFIRAHYDLGNDFYQLMLDDTMMYSCAYFSDPGMSLADASRAKLDRLARKLRVAPDDHVAEIGTGWGGLAVHFAENYGCRVTSVTISDAQFEVARRRVAERGLDDRVTILNLDYRDLGGTYDKVVSVEMVEAIGWRQLPTYFSTLNRLVAPEGLVAVQAITIDDESYERAKWTDDFIKDLVFPGGFLPSLSTLVTTSSRASSLRVLDVDDIGRHYPETLSRWRENLRAHRDQVDALGYPEHFHRLWDLYLGYCEGAFLERHISDVQILFAGPKYRNELGATRGGLAVS